MKHKKHWYKQTVDLCPVCGRLSVYRERIYGKKPKSHSKKYLTRETYDYCIERGYS